MPNPRISRCQTRQPECSDGVMAARLRRVRWMAGAGAEGMGEAQESHEVSLCGIDAGDHFARRVVPARGGCGCDGGRWGRQRGVACLDITLQSGLSAGLRLPPAANRKPVRPTGPSSFAPEAAAPRHSICTPLLRWAMLNSVAAPHRAGRCLLGARQQRIRFGWFGAHTIPRGTRTESSPADGWPSGQRQQTVNLSGYALRRFESFPVHHPQALSARTS